MRSWTYTLVWGLVIGLLTTATSCQSVLPDLAPPGAGPDKPSARPTPLTQGPIRGLWITRWDYRTPTDVTEAIERAASLGVTDVFWQVRGQADAFYRSAIEPWGEELLADLPPGTRDPGFDPLALAVVQAHLHGMRLHAWVNIMPLWKGKEPPKAKDHLFYTHPEWRLFDDSGHPQPLNDHYVIVNPVLEEVQDYIVRVVADIVERYAIDGVHLDYIRFVSENMDANNVYPADPRSISLFTRATGRKALTTDDDHRAFRAWKRNRITALVRRIGTEAVGKRPGLLYTAAVWRDPTIAQVQYLQDAALWAKEGTLDLLMPMIYTDDDSMFRADYQAWVSAVGADRVVPGLGVYKHKTPDQTIRQIEIASSPAGYALFAYASLFDSANPLEPKTPQARSQRWQMREALRAFFQRQSGRTP
ncbi:MAG: glycoside hydrolase family 10 protein [Phycisphaerales bacterium]